MAKWIAAKGGLKISLKNEMQRRAFVIGGWDVAAGSGEGKKGSNGKQDGRAIQGNISMPDGGGEAGSGEGEKGSPAK